MDINLNDVVDRINALPDIETFAAEHGVTVSALRLFEEITPPVTYPPNAGQEAMRGAIAGLEYVFDENETVTLI